jgi:hypothetical protein
MTVKYGILVVLVDNPQNLQEDFKDSYIALSKRYVKFQEVLHTKYPGNTHLIQN